MSVLTSGSAYSVDTYGVFQWIGGSWISRLQTVKNTESVFGTGDDNLFVTGVHGLLMHYNGSDWYEYTYLAQPNVIYSGGWADEKQVFVLGWIDGENSLVLHGKNPAILSGK